MLLADTYLGHRDEVDIDPADARSVTLTDEERRRSRVRTTTDDGTDLGIVVGEILGDGDVLATGDGSPVLVSLASATALVVDLGDAADAELTAAVALGHAAGNRHWDLAIDGDCAYFPVTEDRERMESEVGPHLPAGATIRYDTVSPALFDDGSAGAQPAAADHTHSGTGGGHSHDHDGGHDHSHGHSHSHDEAEHGHDHSHSHDHGHGHSHDHDEEERSGDDDHGHRYVLEHGHGRGQDGGGGTVPEDATDE
jgi:urease accessory protein